MNLIRLKSFLFSVCRLPQETKTIEYVADGYSIEEIASKLNVPIQTVKNILNSIKERCQKSPEIQMLLRK